MEIRLLNKLPGAYEKACCFLGFIKQELEVCNGFLNRAELASFSRYYQFFLDIDTSRLNHFKNAYAQRVQYLVSSAQVGVKVLDAGCGFGSESILAGILGAYVTGVDLSEERLNVANKRLRFYQDKLGRSINVRFYAKSVFDVTDIFDVIWVQDSMSHIEPVEKFIEFANNHLSESGRLIVADANGLNPYVHLRNWNYQRKRGSICKTAKNPQSGKAVLYAQERILTLPLIKGMLVRNGFKVKSTHVSGFCPYYLSSRPFSYHAEEVLSRTPFTKLLGAAYVITAAKNLQEARYERKRSLLSIPEWRPHSMSPDEYFSEPNIHKIRRLASFQHQLVLDAGCGEGFWMYFLLQKSCEYVGVDFVKEMIAEAKRHAKQCERTKAFLVRCDVRALPFKDSVFDATLSLGVIEHFPGTSKALQEYSRVTKNNGVIVISVPNTFDLISKMSKRLHIAHEAIEQKYYTFNSISQKMRQLNIIPQIYEGYDLFSSSGELIIPFMRSLRKRNKQPGSGGRYVSTPRWLIPVAYRLERLWLSKYVSHMIVVKGIVRK